MQREIEFRVLKNDAWVFIVIPKGLAGFSRSILEQLTEKQSVAMFESPWSEFTGLYDKYMTKIYEGDIVQAPGQINKKVFFAKGCWSIALKENMQDLRVVGNVYQNPELLEQICK